ncbi:extracellular solute-binding protein [Caloramator sp. E03]|uniref:extracellular solute-binding protein n=1 Tax=Caloramator sp. E03 TaxID=2576307 RepID=UPI0011100379|nr:extracellular solute-binding protein [Caloramator sp. E03]QCX33316.1 extracellular solute-binding protein [Caloramator sp. E03]
MKKMNIWSILYSILIYTFLYLPIFILVMYSFNNSKLNSVWTGFTTKWYVNLFHDAAILNAMKNTLLIAFVSTMFSIVIGTLTAVGLYRYSFKGKKFIESFLYIPVVIPEIVFGIALLAFFSQIKLPLGLLTLIIAHITFSISYVVIVVKSRLDGFDKSLEEASMDLGATPRETFFKVTLPLIMPGIISGGLLAFTLSLDDVIISFFTAGPSSTTLPLKVFSMVKFGVTPEINALSTIMMLFSIIFVIIAETIKNKNLKSKKIKTILVSLVIIAITTSAGLNIAADKANSEPLVLNIFNWSEYLPQSVIDKFEQTYNVKVNYSTFSSNEEMLAKIMAGGSAYDLVVASDYMVDILVKQDLIQPIDKDNIPNLSNIGSSFLNLEFDKGNVYSVPYMWGDACIVYDTSKIKGNITGFNDLWNPAFKNSIVLLDDERAIIGMALQKNGYSINDTDPEHLEKAKNDLIKLKTNIKAYDSDSPKTLLINGEAKIGYVWGAEAYLAKKENKNLKVVIPKEGLFLQQDNFTIPKGAKQKKLAETFINFIYNPEISAEISKAFPYANPNIEAQKIIDQDILNDIAVYPPEEAVKKGEHLKDIGNDIKYFDKIWSQIKQ